MDPAQDEQSHLGKIVRLELDGTPAGDGAIDGALPDIWSMGHRNILGMDFDAQGRLWRSSTVRRVATSSTSCRRGHHYGWPLRSNGEHYDGGAITDHSADDGFAKAAIGWTPVIAPGSMTFYTGDLFDGLAGDLMIAGLKSQAIVRVAIDGESAPKQPATTWAQGSARSSKARWCAVGARGRRRRATARTGGPGRLKANYIDLAAARA